MPRQAIARYNQAIARYKTWAKRSTAHAKNAIQTTVNAYINNSPTGGERSLGDGGMLPCIDAQFLLLNPNRKVIPIGDEKDPTVEVSETSRRCQ